ncbi:T6SS immunity protein Tli3 family protein [Cupriavidus sp. H18C2]|uniref:T6SS immunity protein Tli3 family protein n=1 Tax=Cupriavidus sp. H18C2 TaxID=3241602 RepID=UPI003BF839FB
MIAYRYILGVFAIAAFLATGCANPSSNRSDAVPSFDVPPQVIYRIDAHRYISLEDYKHCYFGTTYYNDTRLGIRTKFGRGGGIASYRGRLINADPTGRNIVVPSSYPPMGVCPDKGCNIAFIYSTDGGRSFRSGGYYMKNSRSPFEDSAQYIVAATADRIYIAEKIARDIDDYWVEQYPLVSGIDLRQPLPPGIKGDYFRASRRPNYLNGLHTPSGQEYISCDDSIRPSNFPKPTP